MPKKLSVMDGRTDPNYRKTFAFNICLSTGTGHDDCIHLVIQVSNISNTLSNIKER